MKQLLSILILFLVFGCSQEKKKPEVQKTQLNEEISSAEENIYFSAYLSPDTIKVDSNITKDFTIKIRSYSLNDTGVVWESEDKRKYYAHNGELQISLFQNEKLIQETKFPKLDFANILGKEMMTVCDLMYPRIAAFDSVSNSLIIGLNVCFPETDDCHDGFVTLTIPELNENAKGEHGGMWCASEIKTFRNGNIITCSGLYSSEGTLIVDYLKSQVVASERINEESFVIVADLVEYLTDTVDGRTKWIEKRDKISDNCFIYSSNGKLLSSFKYHGYYQPMGYDCPFIHINDSTLVFFDLDSNYSYFVSNSVCEKKQLEELDDNFDDPEYFKEYEISTIIEKETILTDGIDVYKKP